MDDLSSRSTLKKNVKELFKGNWINAIKVNIVPIIISVLGCFISAFGVVVAAMMVDQEHEYSRHAFGRGNDSALSFVLQAVLTFIIVGSQFGLLDWLRDHTKVPSYKTAFQIFTRDNFIPALAMYLFQWIFILGWTLLLVVPGIIKRFSYSQTYFLYKAAKERGINGKFEYYDYVTFSRRLMDGNKWRLFMLNLSLIGWYILAVLSIGIGFVWLIPYQNALYSEFFNDLAAKEGAQKVPEIFA